MKSDKYNRCLTDVFIPAKPSGSLSPERRSRMGGDFTYLNQKLIEEGLAVAVRD